ncbi:MAG: hypothetical protein ACE5FT_04375 [Candidatus Nanoarchaeia archaeon]
MTLHNTLQGVDSIREGSSYGGYSEERKVLLSRFSLEEINEPLFERKIFEDYDNPILQCAIDRTYSIEESLRIMSEYYSGIKKWSPGMFSQWQNDRVNFMGELVTKPLHLLTRSNYHMDNIITATAYPAAVIGLSALALGSDPNLALATTTFFSGFSGLVFPPCFRTDPIPLGEAIFLDNKIEELF